MNNKQKTWLIFVWLIAIIAVASAVILRPTREELTGHEAALKSINQDIQIQKDKHSNQAKKLQTSNFNLTETLKKAQDKLTEATKFAVGGAKDRDEFDSKKDELNKQFTSNVTKQLLNLNAAGSEDPLYTRDFEFKLANITEVKVVFVNTDDPSHAKIDIVLTFKTKDRKAREQNALITLNYDLTKLQANSGSFKQFAENFDDTGDKK